MAKITYMAEIWDKREKDREIDIWQIAWTIFELTGSLHRTVEVLNKVSEDLEKRRKNGISNN